MEEILASIRRIISEEDEPAAVAEEPLELTQPAEEEPPVIEAAPPAPAPAPEPMSLEEEDDLVFEAEAEPAFAPAPEPTPAPAAAPAPMAAAPAPAGEPIADSMLSQPAASAAAGALQRLAGTLRIADTPGQTVEGVVRELLKPMLKEWLDQNLAAIVEARVEAELERISRLAR